MTDLDAIRVRVDAATSGPWDVYDPNEAGGYLPLWCVANDPYHNPPDDDEAWPAVNVVVETGTREDAVFVAHAREDVPALLAEVDRLRAQLTETAATLRRVAVGRRDYARPDFPHRDLIEHECEALDCAAEIVEGNRESLYSLLPSWHWTDEMLEAIDRG